MLTLLPYLLIGTLKLYKERPEALISSLACSQSATLDMWVVPSVYPLP